ncbi:MAG: hypothetical protein IH984_13260 [Planctomycetes bacterium]|nr:hypothetical protein [Planctomycetota bacterium]
MAPVASGTDSATRQSAAEELIAMKIPQAFAVLTAALGSDQEPVVIAVINALDSAAEPVTELLPAAISTLQNGSPTVVSRLSIVLPRYGNSALKQVADATLDARAASAQRLGPISALGSFRSRESAGYLMQLLERQPTEPQDILNGVCDSLQKLTGLPHGRNVNRWRTWWAEHKNEPYEDWLRIMVQRLSSRITQLEQQAQQQQTSLDDAAKRIAEAERELFVRLSPQEQFVRLQQLLGEPWTDVRQFAVDRVERLLRDSEIPPVDVQDKLAQRLADPGESPTLRVSTARLLNDLNYTSTAELVVAVLAHETDPSRAAAYLEILYKRPTIEGFELAVKWLSHTDAKSAAADALWALVINGSLNQDQLTKVSVAIRQTLGEDVQVSGARLLAGLGQQPDGAQLETWLNSDDPLLRSAVAEGLAHAKIIDPLRQHAADEAVFPYLVKLLSRGPYDVATLRELAALVAPTAQNQMWTTTLVTFSSKLPANLMLQADDVLIGITHIDETLRGIILSRGAQLSENALSADERWPLFMRLSELWIVTGKYQQAHDLLLRIDKTVTLPNLAQLRFKAAALANQYELAFGMAGDSATWVKLLSETVEADPQVAARLRDEISRRFADGLDEQTKAMFDAANAKIIDESGNSGAIENESAG